MPHSRSSLANANFIISAKGKNLRTISHALGLRSRGSESRTRSSDGIRRPTRTARRPSGASIRQSRTCRSTWGWSRTPAPSAAHFRCQSCVRAARQWRAAAASGCRGPVWSTCVGATRDAPVSGPVRHSSPPSPPPERSRKSEAYLHPTGSARHPQKKQLDEWVIRRPQEACPNVIVKRKALL